MGKSMSESSKIASDSSTNGKANANVEKDVHRRRIQKRLIHKFYKMKYLLNYTIENYAGFLQEIESFMKIKEDWKKCQKELEEDIKKASVEKDQNEMTKTFCW